MDPRLTVTGNVGAAVTQRVTPNGTHISELSVASTRRVFKDGQWSDGPTTWWNVRCFGRLAENVASSVKKGEALVVMGRLEVDSWHAQDGGIRSKTWVVADAVGHDLTRGTAVFTRPARSIEPVPDYGSEPPPDLDEEASAAVFERRAS